MPERKNPTPPFGAGRRHQTNTERDLDGLAAKTRRDSERREPVPEEVDEDITSQYETGLIDEDELEARRAKRPTLERIARQEKKQDKTERELGQLAGQVGELAVAVEGLQGEMKHVPRLIGLLERSLDQANATVSVTVNDQVAGNKQRRDFWGQVGLKALAALGAIAGIVYVVLQAQAQGCGR